MPEDYPRCAPGLIAGSGKEFDVDEVFYKYLRKGDEVEIHCW